MARNTFTDPSGRRYLKTSLTMYVPLDLVAFIRDRTGWSEPELPPPTVLPLAWPVWPAWSLGTARALSSRP